jgi:hypothetical protein
MSRLGLYVQASPRIRTACCSTPWCLKMLASNRLEFARAARPTRNGEAPLLAAQAGRWALRISS